MLAVRWPMLAVRWPTVACLTLAVVGCHGSMLAVRWPMLAVVGLRWLSWAVGLRWPLWAFIGLRTCVDCRGLALAFVGLPGLGL